MEKTECVVLNTPEFGVFGWVSVSTVLSCIKRFAYLDTLLIVGGVKSV